ncbi:MAG: hypothetical protein SF339_01580 [Blastocatellia bacterium]|nr:hypothetical protein [Blastocatellia bacterium]
MKASALRTIAALFCLLSLGLFAGACRATNPTERQAPASPTSPAAGNPARVAVRSDIGFATRQKFLDHYGKHGHEFGAISREEYLRRAQELRDRPVSNDILESVRRDGVVTRFDKAGGAFLAFNADLTIRTYFKPNDGENYFRRQSRR